ncbi:hypothetical protein OIU14_06135 [Thalassobacter stenotrophicus]|uniref:DUF6880 family protein n=1 Tax=Thalassobacter stenotrophicus TaxID=266809 RepID=UPI0022A92843|nr:DUF6880 family protein [Thalassobacter stenotrophicus]UYP69303.1 hypothetical protein OIU14_06135 [Thalassobacter stenotrophicus]
MSKKTLNAANLAALGADRLADLLIEVSTGSADIKRRLRMELSHNLGPEELAHDVRKRLVSLRKSKSYVSWRKRKALVTDLNTQIAMIVDKIAPDDPKTAFELLWQFMELAPSIYARADDRRGDIEDVFQAALQHFENIGPRTQMDRAALAERVWSAVSDNAHGEWNDIIGLLAETLGTDGLDALKQQVQQYRDAPGSDTGSEHEAFEFLRSLRGDRDYRAERRQALVRKCLQEIAEVSGDTNAYIAQFTPDDLQRKSVAAEVAMLKVSEGRAEDALTVLENAERSRGTYGQDAWDTAYIDTLLALDRTQDAQEHRWACFEDNLNASHLRAFLKVLPDFDDVEAEDRARAHVLAYPNLAAALHFCLTWPDLLTASQLVIARADQLDGEDYEFLNGAADALRAQYPLAATLLLRAMIDFALCSGRTSRYGHAINHLRDCEALSLEILDYGDVQTHSAYREALQTMHAGKTTFWARIENM